MKRTPGYIQCRNCGRYGHRSIDCKHDTTTCHNCGKDGHKSDKCTNPTLTCHSCGRTGHYSDKCPSKNSSSSPSNQGVTCYKCNQQGHYSDSCPSANSAPISKRSVTCYKCGQPGHYSDKCPSANSSSSPTNQCYKCGQPGHYSDKCPSVNSSSSLTNILSISNPSRNIKSVKLELDGMWGSDSALVKENTDFHRIKFSIIEALLKENIVTQDGIDERNKIAHIDIKGDTELYKKLDNSTIKLCIAHFKFNRNLIEIDLDELAGMKSHYCIIFTKNIGDKKIECKRIITDLFFSQPLEEKKAESEPTLCCICYELPNTYACIPCGHKCLCKTCSDTIKSTSNSCPICRSNCTAYLQIFQD